MNQLLKRLEALDIEQGINIKIIGIIKISFPFPKKGNLTFINENITFKCATLNVIILYANNKKILHKAKTRANPSP